MTARRLEAPGWRAIVLPRLTWLGALLGTFALATLTSCANPWIPRPGTPLQHNPVLRENKPSHLVVGNYCGYGTRRGDLSARPQDRLDAACLEHDACYIAGRDRCSCNEELVEAAKAIMADPRTGSALRARAAIIRDFFPAMTPICSMFPQGIMPPRKQDVLKTRYRERSSRW